MKVRGLCGLGLLLAVLAGCSVSVDDAVPTQGTADRAPAESGSRSGVNPESLLESAMEVLRSTRPGPDTYHLAADRLNHYFRTRPAAERAQFALPEVVERDLNARLVPELMDRVRRAEFDAEDAIYVAGLVMLKAVADRVAADEHDALTIATRLFDWVIRSLPQSLLDARREVPIPLLHALVGGHARGGERAWAFIELLHQQYIDACVLAVEVKGQEGQSRWVPWCVGVVVDESLYLFDPWRLTVLADRDGRPLTLEAVRKDPAVLERLSEAMGGNYPATTGNIQRVLAWVGGRPECWAPRMRHLESRLAGQYQVVLTMDLPKLVSKIRAAGGEAIGQIELWPLPNDAVVAARTREGQRLIARLLGPLALPAVQEARLLHLYGELARARDLYLELREPKVRLPELPPEAEALRQTVREYATFFMGQLKADEGDWKVAHSWFTRSYLKKYGDGGIWSGAAYLAAGLCLEHLDRLDEAVQWYEQPQVRKLVPELAARAAILKARQESARQPSDDETKANRPSSD